MSRKPTTRSDRLAMERYLRDLLRKKAQRIAELEQENESYQKLINDICNKHRVGSLKELDEIIQATNESLYASREYLEELKSAKWELEEQLKNAIVPKFRIGQEVWWIDTRVNSFNEQRYRIESYLIDSIVITNEQFRYYGDDGLWLGDNELFATKEEAQAKLEELGERE